MKKKVIVLLALLCLFACSLFADDFTSCLNLIDKKLNASTVAEVQKYSANLSESQKYSIYESKKSSGTIPFVVNFFLGCGIGSYIQGDVLGGTISLCGDVGGYALIVGGYVSAAASAVSNSSSGLAGGSAAVIAGGAILLANRIFTCIRPFTYASSYNKRLSTALYASTSFAMVPSINEKGQPEVVLVGKVNF